MTDHEFQKLLKRCQPTPQSDVYRLVIEDYREAINLLAGIDPTGRTFALDLHKSLGPGDCRLKHLVYFHNDWAIAFLGAFFRGRKRLGGKRRTYTRVFIYRSDGAYYVGEQAAEHREAYHAAVNAAGGFPVHINPHN